MARHFRALVRVRATAEGGRHHPINVRGYRPDLSFEGEQYWYGAQLVPEGEDDDRRIKPGESAEVDFELRTLPGILPRLSVGLGFKMMEGTAPVADCVVTVIYPTPGKS